MPEETRVSTLIKRWRSLELVRGLWMHHWEDLARVELPGRLGFVTNYEVGSRRVDNIFDGTAMRAARRLANAVGGMLRPEGEPWFFIKAGNDAEGRTDEAKDWLSDTERRMREAFDNPKARFRQATGEADMDLVVLGTAIVFVAEGPGHLVFQSVHLKDGLPFYGETGNTEGMFRSRMLTVRQADNRWGKGKLSERLRALIEEDKLDEKHRFLFATLPRKEGRVDALLARNLPFADLAIEVDQKHEVAVNGFNEFPYVVPRWDTSSGEDYGRSPGMIALPDANTAQAQGETLLVAGQRAADPPLLTPSDAFIDAPNTYPGGLATYEADALRDLGANAIRPLEGGRNFPITFEMQRVNREQIDSAFMREVFNLPPPGDAAMTATEVVARLKEFIREMGPVFGRLETDYTAPMVERSFNIMLRAGQFLPIPESLRSVRFEYESPVKRIREQALVEASRVWVGDQVQAAEQTGRADILDYVDFDGWSQFSHDALTLPPEIIKGDDEVQALREQRAAQQAALEQAARVQAGIETAKAGAEGIEKISRATQNGAGNGR